MRRGDIRKLTVEGETFDGAFLGRGRYCQAFRRLGGPNRGLGRVYCFVVDGEYMKETLSAHWVTPLPHMPEISKHDDAQISGRGPWFSVYSMPYYRTITAADAAAWQIFKTLKAAAARLVGNYGTGRGQSLTTHGHQFTRDIIDATRGRVPASVTAALEYMAELAGMYGSGVTVEFAARNLGVDERGQIVFRDILFDAEKLAAERMAKVRAARGY